MQYLNALEAKNLAELREIAKALGIKNVMVKKKRELKEMIAAVALTEEPAAENKSEHADTPVEQSSDPQSKAPRGRRPRLAKVENAATGEQIPAPETVAAELREPRTEAAAESPATTLFAALQASSAQS